MSQRLWTRLYARRGGVSRKSGLLAKGKVNTMSTWRKVVCCLATVAVAGVSDTAVAADVNFKWKAEVLSGNWKDGANWDRGTYPNALATDYATFSKGTYEVTVPNGTTNKYIQLVTDVTLKLKGVRDENGAQAQMRSGAVRYSGGTYSRCNLIVDDLYYFYDNSGTTAGSDALVLTVRSS